MANLTAGVQSTFPQHQKETQRRSHVVPQDESSVNPSHFPRADTDVADAPFLDPEQRFVVFSLSQQEFAPRPEEPDNPAVCIYGTFPSRDDATQHASVVLAKHPGFSILVDETHKWIVAPTSVAHLTDAEYIDGKRESLLTSYRAIRDKDDADFAENVRDKKIGAAHASDEKGEAAQAPDSQGPTHRVHAECRVVDQRMAVVSFVRDTAQPPEFLLRIYACMETDAQANAHVRNVCGDHVRDFDIDVVKTCSWVFPQRMEGAKSQKEVFRSPELNAVMQAHKKNPQEVERFYKEAAAWDAEKTLHSDDTIAASNNDVAAS